MIHRSFLVPANAREATFTAPVAKFLGVIPGPGAFVICALCDGPPPVASGLVLPNGQAAPAALKEGEPAWIVNVCFEADEPPAAWGEGRAQYLGSVLTGLGPAAVYVRRA